MDMVCNVRVAARSGGEERVFTGFGTLSMDSNGFAVHYEDGQDSIELTLRNGVFCMERHGETNLSARFCLGEETEMQILLGDMRGALPIRTYILKKQDFSDKILLTLGYRLGEGEHSTPFYLQMQFSFSEEP